ncbi:nucleotidyltransferase family protein [bacterium]|nr:nucleotidyltransferase family protein [bacterium]
MQSIEEIVAELRKYESALKIKYAIKSMSVFGSYVRGEQTPESDLDVLVEFQKPVGFFKFLELEEELEYLLHKKVDLVSKAALKPAIGKYILQEAYPI